MLGAAVTGVTRAVLWSTSELRGVGRPQGKARVFPSCGVGRWETPLAALPAGADFIASVRDRERALRKGNSPLKVWE